MVSLRKDPRSGSLGKLAGNSRTDGGGDDREGRTKGGPNRRPISDWLMHVADVAGAPLQTNRKLTEDVAGVPSGHGWPPV